MPESVLVKTFDLLQVRILPDKRSLGGAAAATASGILQDAIRIRRHARVIVGTGPSQGEVIAAITADPAINWSRITVFHMDEYIGIAADHPASFRRWLRTHVADVVHPAMVHYLDGDAADPQAEAQRYGALLQEAPVDLCFAGFGENGHIAFNDPPVADFADPLAVKLVHLDEACRRQQVGEGHFPSIDAVPPQALTITCPTVMACCHLVCSVPDRRKAEAVRAALERPVSTACPASIVRRHSRAWLFLDSASASLLARGNWDGE